MASENGKPLKATFMKVNGSTTGSMEKAYSSTASALTKANL